MIALTDTHALRWWLDGSNRLPARARNVFDNKMDSVVVSTVVPWELAIKTNIGKLRVEPLLASWAHMLETQGFTELHIDSKHAIRAGLLPLHHRDPFDRMLVAQAQATGWPIISGDPVFDHYGVRRIW
ncbi:MAG TPA: type II toxin-antitoxin system VapC family toxin [Terriglobales bacterium]|nr:type II toxin-antitoxin system VapC family toxin [Terriglobales bacterium]